MSRPELWVAMLLMGALSLALRSSFLLFQERFALPTRLERVLRFVPAAVLAALITPALLVGEAGGLAAPTDPRLLAGAVAALVAWRSRNIPITVAVGMAALWSLQALL